MNFNFTYGRAYSNLKKECIKRLQTDLTNENADKILVIANKHYKKELEIELNNNDIIDSELKIQISTIDELCANTINIFGDRRIKILNEDEELALILYSANKVKDNLKLYNNLTLDKTFLKSIKNTISIFKKEQVTVKTLESKLNDINNQLTKDKLSDVISIFKEYTNNLSDKYLDTDDKLNYVIKLLENNKETSNYIIYLYKMESITNQELEFIKTVSEDPLDINVFINNDAFDREPSNLSGAFFKTDLLIKKIKRLYDNTEIKFSSKYIENNIDSKELKHLEENLYSYPYSELKEDLQDIFVTECSSIENEVEILTSNIEVLRQNNVDLNSIYITASNISQYERTLKTMLSKCDIPYSIQSKKNLGFNIISRYIEILLKLSENESVDLFLRFIKTGLNVFTLDNVGILEQYIKTNTISYIKEIDMQELIRLKFTQEEELKLLIENIDLLFNEYSKLNNFTDFYQATFNFFNQIQVLDVIKNIIDEELKNSDESETLKTWESIIKLLDSYNTALNSLEINKDMFIFLFRGAISNLEMTIKLDTPGVNIVSLNSLSESLENIFILGANDGCIPSKPKTSTVFTERDILELNLVNLLNGEDIISLVLSEQFNTYKLLTLANQKLFISFTTTGKDLAVMKKSTIISRLQQLFPSIKPFNTSLKDKKFSNLNNFKTIKNIVNEIHLSEKIDRLNEVNKLEELKDIPLYSEYIDSVITAFNYDNKATCEDKYTLQSLYYSDTLSVSKLEKYAKCPFAYFSEYALKVKEDEPTTVQAKHIGIVVHGIIEQFDKRLQKNNKTWDNIDESYIEEEVNLIMNYLEKRSALNIFNTKQSSKYYINKLKELAKTSIFALTKHIGNSFFECAGHEINFDDMGKYPPITIKLPSGKRVKLRGQIDRLDLLKNPNGKFIRIVDYKTGNTKLDLTEVLYGTQLQLLTYLDAIIESGEENEYLPAGAFYLKVDDPFIKATPCINDEYINENRLKELRMKGLFINNESIVELMDKGIYDGEYKTSLNIQAKFKTDGTLSKSTPGISIKDLEILRKYTKEIIKESAYNMLVKGDISINPMKKKNIEACTYCAYKNICQFDETLEFNTFNNLVEFSDEEIINIASKKVSDKNE